MDCFLYDICLRHERVNSGTNEKVILGARLIDVVGGLTHYSLVLLF